MWLQAALGGKAACHLNTKDCMLQKCQSCPSKEAFERNIRGLGLGRINRILILTKGSYWPQNAGKKILTASSKNLLAKFGNWLATNLFQNIEVDIWSYWKPALNKPHWLYWRITHLLSEIMLKAFTGTICKPQCIRSSLLMSIKMTRCEFSAAD